MLGLGEEHGVSWATTVQEFGMMDEDGGGAVRFDEFCAWCARKTHAALATEDSKQTATASNAAPPKKLSKALYSMMYYVTIDEDGEEEASEEVPVSEVRKLIVSGDVTKETQVWAEGMDDEGGWQALSDCADVFGLGSAISERPPPPPPHPHELEPAEGGARSAIIEMVPLFDEVQGFLKKVSTDDRSVPDVASAYADGHRVIQSRPRGESWGAQEPQLVKKPCGPSRGGSPRDSKPPSPSQTSPLSPVRARLMAGQYASTSSPTASDSSFEDDLGHSRLIRRPRGPSWAQPVLGSRTPPVPTSMVRVAERDSDSDSDDDDGAATPDFADLSAAVNPVSQLSLEHRWKALGGSDRMLIQIKQNLRGASYNKGGQDPQKLFQYYDKDNSGDIDRWEFRQAIRKGGRVTPAMMSDDELERLFDCVDVDGHGDLRIDELIEMVWGKDFKASTPGKKGKQAQAKAHAAASATVSAYRGQAKRMTDDAQFDCLHEYYLHDTITVQRKPPPAKTIRTALAQNDFEVLCGKLETKYGVHPLAMYNERHAAAVPKPTPRSIKEKQRQSGSTAFGARRGRDATPQRGGGSPGGAVSPARTRRSTPPRRAATKGAAKSTPPKSKAEESRRFSRVKQGTLRKLASGAAAEGGWLSLGSSEKPDHNSDDLDAKKEDARSWHPQQVEIELLRVPLPTAGSLVTATVFFGAPGDEVVKTSAMGKMSLESTSEVLYTGGSDFTIVGKDGARHCFAPVRPGGHGLEEAAADEGWGVEVCESWVAALRLAQHATDRALSCRLLFRCVHASTLHAPNLMRTFLCVPPLRCLSRRLTLLAVSFVWYRYYRQVVGETRTKQELEQTVETRGGEQLPALCDELAEKHGVHPASLLVG